MLQFKAALSLSALTVSAAVAAYVDNPKPEPVFIEASQYSAVLHQRSHEWKLLSPDGNDLTVSNAGANCVAQAPLPVHDAVTDRFLVFPGAGVFTGSVAGFGFHARKQPLAVRLRRAVRCVSLATRRSSRRARRAAWR